MRRGRILDWIALNLLPGVGPILARRALERFGDAGEAAHRAPLDALAALGLRGAALKQAARARRDLPREAERELRRAEKLGVSLAAPGDPAYPAILETLPDPPILLYYRGELRAEAVRLAVVGSRRATAYGRRVAVGLGGGLASRGIEVVSGGARGIDTCAHLGALEEPGGRTLAVLGSGLANLYPPENAELFERIASAGAVVSEFPLDAPPLREHFPRRNRLISGLSAAVIVVEASTRSGSLVTAGHALEQGREVLAVPGPVSSEQSQGCHKLIQDGAKLVQNVDDILDELSPMYTRALPEHSPAAGAPTAPIEGATDDERAVLALLDPAEPLHLDELADRAPFGIARLQAALFGLELRGAIEPTRGHYYLRR